MITTVKEAKLKVADFVQLVTGRTTILAHGDGPQLNEPYCSIKDDSIVGVQHDTTKQEIVEVEGEDEIQETVRGLGKFSYTVEAWGGDSMNVLNKLKASFWSALFMDKMNVEGIGLSDIGEVQDTSAPFISAKWEDRAQLSISFYISVPVELIIDHFDKDKILVKEENLQYNNELDIGPIEE